MVTDLEQALISLALHDRQVAEMITSSLTEDQFTNPTAKMIFRILRKLVSSDQTIDPFQVAMSLPVNERKFILQISAMGLENLDGTAREEAARQWVKLLIKERLAEEFSNRLAQLAARARETPNALQEIIAEAENAIGEVLARYPIEESEIPMLSELMPLLNRERDTVRTGLPSIDHALLSASPGDLFIIAGRTSVGKTAFAIQLSIQSSIVNRKIVYVTLEMNKSEILARFCSFIGFIPAGWFYNPRTYMVKPLEIALKFLSRLPIKIIDPSAHADAFDVPQLSIILQSLAPDIVVIDYLHLMASAQDTGMVEALSELSRELKRLALRYQCIIVGLSQINRTAQASEADIEQIYYSSAIAHTASQVLMLRPKKTVEIVQSNMRTITVREIELALVKNRNGPTISITSLFIPMLMRFCELPPEEITQDKSKKPKANK